jgi:hypothetical protein
MRDGITKRTVRTITHPAVVVVVLVGWVLGLSWLAGTSSEEAAAARKSALATLAAVPAAEAAYRERHGAYGDLRGLVAEGFLPAAEFEPYRLELRLGEGPAAIWCARVCSNDHREPFYWIGPRTEGIVVDEGRRDFDAACTIPAGARGLTPGPGPQ